MSTTQPLKDRKQIEQLKNYYYEEKPNVRNYALICLGINSALRISDLLKLKWKDVYHFEEMKFLKHLQIFEKKTKKYNQIALNKNAIETLTFYMEQLDTVTAEDYLFPGRNSSVPLSRSQAFRIIQKAGEQLHFENSISCHSLRKTFGYHAWKSGVQPAMLMAIYNHSSYFITKRYLGIEQDDKDGVFLSVNL